MRALIVGLIGVYQHIAPASLRERCIFAESCSNYVRRVASERGFAAALAAFATRVRQCRPGFALLQEGGEIPRVMLADGSMIDDRALSARARTLLGLPS